MKVTFSFQENEILKSALSVGGEWNAPFLPRVGDKIDASLLLQWLSPQQLFDALWDDEKEIWNSWLNEGQEDEMTEEEAWMENFTIWMWHVGSVVQDVIWGHADNDYHVHIVLKGVDR